MPYDLTATLGSWPRRSGRSEAVAEHSKDRRRHRFRDIAEHATAARDTVRALSRDEFFQNAIVQKAVCFDLLCISEATARLLEADPTLAQRYPDVPWRQVRAIGNVLRHEYDRIDMNIVWDTVTTDDLNTLTAAIEKERELLGG